MAFALLLVPGLLLFLFSSAYSLNGGETQVTTSVAEQTDPAISGDYIVYTDDRNGNGDIYLYQISSKTETNLTPGTHTYQYLNDIDGVRVVYTNVTAGASDIYLYDISTSAGTPLTSGGNNYAPKVDGDHVVWVEVGASARNVILADLVAWSTTSITANPIFVDVPRVDGDWVVWEEWEELVAGKRQIKAYRITTAETRTLTTDASDHRWPDVSGSLVVWADNRNGNWDIYSHDLDTSALTRLTTDLADQQYPRISGTRVVWEDSRSGISQIWTLDLETGVAEPLSPSAHPQYLNAIDGSRVVWTENRYPSSFHSRLDFDWTWTSSVCPGGGLTVTSIYVAETRITSGSVSCITGGEQFAKDLSENINNTGTGFTATYNGGYYQFAVVTIWAPPGLNLGGIFPEVFRSGSSFSSGSTSFSNDNYDIFMFTVATTPACGDGLCNGTETCSSCPADCGVCPPACGDGTCNGTETCSSCPQDCGACPPVCGDGTCNGTETCSSCPQDCGVCPNTPPVAHNQSVAVTYDVPTAITLTASDADGDPLTYGILSNPSHGTLTGAAPNLTYTPDAGYYGFDSFTFKANDGTSDSNTATVSITVNPMVGDIVVLLPIGSEFLPSGGIYGICWQAPLSAVKFDLQYTINNGTSWNFIKTVTGLNCTHWEEVPVVTANKKNCYAKVIAYDSNNVKIGEDVSERFTIEVLRITSPNGGEALRPGSAWSIGWKSFETTRPVANTKLLYTTNGTTYNLIKTFKGDPGANNAGYSWRVPNVSSTKCKVKVVLKDASGVNVGTDVSDKVFTIQP
jgi:beta propeller repeat protein